MREERSSSSEAKRRAMSWSVVSWSILPCSAGGRIRAEAQALFEADDAVLSLERIAAGEHRR